MTGIKVFLLLLVAALHLPGGDRGGSAGGGHSDGEGRCRLPSLFYLYRTYHAPVIMQDVSAEEACFFGINGL